MTMPNDAPIPETDFSVEAFLKQKKEFEDAILNKNLTEIKRVFTNPDECAIISDLSSTLHEVSIGLNELSEAFLQNMVGIQVFVKHLVGVGKLISKEDFAKSVDETYLEATSQQA